MVPREGGHGGRVRVKYGGAGVLTAARTLITPPENPR